MGRRDSLWESKIHRCLLSRDFGNDTCWSVGSCVVLVEVLTVSRSQHCEPFAAQHISAIHALYPHHAGVCYSCLDSSGTRAQKVGISLAEIRTYS